MPKVVKFPTTRERQSTLTYRHARAGTSGDYDPAQFRHICTSKCDTKHRWHMCSYEGCGHITRQAGNIKTHELRVHTLITFPCKAGCSSFRWVDPARYTRHLQMVHGQTHAPRRRASNGNVRGRKDEEIQGEDAHTGSMHDRASSVASSTFGGWSTSEASSSSLVSSRSTSPLACECSVHSVSFTDNIEELKESKEISCNGGIRSVPAQDSDVPVSSRLSTSMAVSFTEMLNMPWSVYASLSVG